MLNLILIWIAVGVGLVLLNRRSSAGLLLAYFLGSSIIYVPGALIHLEAEESNWTRLGFEQTVIGLVSLLVGAIIARIITFRRRSEQTGDVIRQCDLNPGFLAALNRLALSYCLFGGIAYFVLMPLSGAIPSATAIVSSIGTLIVVGACLRLWVAREGRDGQRFWSTIALLPLLPLFTLIQAGFVGYGTYWALTISCFLFAQTKRRLLYYCVLPIVLYVGLSVFVNYMAARDDIRKLVWYEQASLIDRVDRVVDVFNNFEWLDLSNAKQRHQIEIRLNQNLLVGGAVAMLESGRKPYAFGASISNVIVDLIPRALWPDKPTVGGGGSLVTEYTGIRFPRDTSVGAGQVFEFYVNFGTWGVITGFLIYGWLLASMELTIISSLYQGDQRRFLFWFMIAVSLMQPGGNLVEIVVSVAAAIFGAYGVNHLLNPRRSGVDLPTFRRKISA